MLKNNFLKDTCDKEMFNLRSCCFAIKRFGGRQSFAGNYKKRRANIPNGSGAIF
jgi:hypothetical protein